MVYVGSRNVSNYKNDAIILVLVSITATRRTRRSELQHDIGQDDGQAQKGATDEFTHRAASAVTSASAGGIGSTASPRGSSRAGASGREGGSDDGGSGRDRSCGSPFFDLVINPGNERSQVSALHILGEVEQFDPRDRAREVLRRGEVASLTINDDGIPVRV